METVSNVVNAATKAIWGEPQNTTTATNETDGSEPISGQQGKGTVTEPYDQGNAALGEQHATATTLGNETGGEEPVSGLQGKGTVSEPFDQGNTALPADPTSKPTVSDPTSKLETPTHVPTTFEEFKPDTSSNTDSSTVPQTQLPIHPPKAAELKPFDKTSEPDVSAPAQTYTFINGNLVPSDSVSEAPKADVSHAINSKKDGADTLIKTHPGGESKAGLPSGLDLGKEPKGTGEANVKPTGLLSDSGDIATKPGAGKEADRIAERTGDHHNASGKLDSKPVAPASGEKEKVSKMDKIKDKLHIGHKDK